MAKKRGISFTRRAPDNLTEELVAVLSSKASFEFKPLFDILLVNLRQRNAASGGEELLRLRAYEKLQGLVHQGAVQREVTGLTKTYKGVAKRMVALRAEMKALRAACDERALARASAGN
jgi:regulator of RNase E activity RraA